MTGGIADPRHTEAGRGLPGRQGQVAQTESIVGHRQGGARADVGQGDTGRGGVLVGQRVTDGCAAKSHTDPGWSHRTGGRSRVRHRSRATTR